MRPIPQDRFQYLAAPITITWAQLEYLTDPPAALHSQRLLAVGDDGSLLVQALDVETQQPMEGSEVWIDIAGEEMHPG